VLHASNGPEGQAGDDGQLAGEERAGEGERDERQHHDEVAVLDRRGVEDVQEDRDRGERQDGEGPGLAVAGTDGLAHEPRHAERDGQEARGQRGAPEDGLGLLGEPPGLGPDLGEAGPVGPEQAALAHGDHEQGGEDARGREEGPAPRDGPGGGAQEGPRELARRPVPPGLREQGRCQGEDERGVPDPGRDGQDERADDRELPPPRRAHGDPPEDVELDATREEPERRVEERDAVDRPRPGGADRRRARAPERSQPMPRPGGTRDRDRRPGQRHRDVADLEVAGRGPRELVGQRHVPGRQPLGARGRRSPGGPTAPPGKPASRKRAPMTALSSSFWRRW
jgi:hypothetical protein